MNEYVVADLELVKTTRQAKDREQASVTNWHVNKAIKKRNALLTQLRNIDTKKSNQLTQERGEDETLFSIVTFNSIQDKLKFVDALKQPWCPCCFKKPPKFKQEQLRGAAKEFTLYTSQPRHPTQILWENLHYGWCTCCRCCRKNNEHSKDLLQKGTYDRGDWKNDLCIRRGSVALLALFLILLTFGGSVYLNAVAKASDECPDWSSDLILADTGLCGSCGQKGEDKFHTNSSSTDYQQCFSHISQEEMYNSNDINDAAVAQESCFWRDENVTDATDACTAQFLVDCYCLTYFWNSCCLSYYGDYSKVAEKIVAQFGISLGISLCLVFASFMMRFILGYVVSFEHAHSRASNEIHAATRILVFQLLNSGLLLLFLPIDGESLCASTADCFSFTINEAWKIKIFTVEWYDIIGPLVISTNLCYAITSWLPYIFYPLPHKYKRHGLLAIHACVSDIEMNVKGMAEPFTLRDRVADMMTVFFLTIMFSSGYPILLPIASFAFFAMYWVDKYLILRYYSIDSEYSLEIMKRMTKLIPLGIVLHCVGAVAMFGNYQIFLDMGEPADRNGTCFTDSDRRTWCKYDQKYNLDDAAIAMVMPLILLGVGIVVTYLLFKISTVICAPCYKNSQSTMKENNTMTYSDFAFHSTTNELVSYNMLANPKYQKMLGLEGQHAQLWKQEGKKHLHDLKNTIRGGYRSKERAILFRYSTDKRNGGCCMRARTFTDSEIQDSRWYFLVSPRCWPWACCCR